MPPVRPPSRQSDHRVLPLPDTRQQTQYTCGPSSLKSILAYFGVSRATEKELARLLGSHPDKGTAPERIIKLAREFGLKADMHTEMTLDDLARCAKRDAPVIVAFQAWREQVVRPWSDEWDDGHYAVVIGVDAERVYLEDPSLKGSIGSIPRREFMERWHDQDGNGRRLLQLGLVIESDKPAERRRPEPSRLPIIPID